MKLDKYSPSVHISGPKKTVFEAKTRCHRCRGSGQAPCQICNGKGEVVMGKTLRGGPIYARCQGCFGRKTKRCASCFGEGFY